MRDDDTIWVKPEQHPCPMPDCDYAALFPGVTAAHVEMRHPYSLSADPVGATTDDHWS